MKYWAMLPFLIAAFGDLGGGWASDYLCTKIGFKWGRRLIGGGGLLSGGVFLMLMAATANPVLAAILLAVSYGCQDSMLPVSWAVCMDVGGKHCGGISASMNMAGQVGSLISSVAFGYAVACSGSIISVCTTNSTCQFIRLRQCLSSAGCFS